MEFTLVTLSLSWLLAWFLLVLAVAASVAHDVRAGHAGWLSKSEAMGGGQQRNIGGIMETLKIWCKISIHKAHYFGGSYL